MLARAGARLAALGPDVVARVTLRHGDVFTTPWPVGFHLAVLGGNCLYELASADEQEKVIARSARSLLSGGHLFMDNNHMEGPLAVSWQDPSPRPAFPTGTCSGGTRVESTMQTVWFDVDARLARFRRVVTVTSPDGGQSVHEYTQQKHAPSYDEMRRWIRASGLRVEACFGTRVGTPYTPDAPRAIFWAVKP
jgi:hypothetical protein